MKQEFEIVFDFLPAKDAEDRLLKVYEMVFEEIEKMLNEEESRNEY